MKSISILALAAALTWASATPNFAQTTVSTDVGAAVSADTNGDGNVSAEEQSASDATARTTANASVSAEAHGSVTVDTNGDGTYSAEEVAAINATIAASGNSSLVLDANGDGTVSAAEVAAIEAALSASSMDAIECDASGIGGLMSGMTMADSTGLMSATKVKIVMVSNCKEDEVTSALATAGAANVRDALKANAAAIAEIQARGSSIADVLGATIKGDTVTVYVVSIAS